MDRASVLNAGLRRTRFALSLLTFGAYRFRVGAGIDSSLSPTTLDWRCKRLGQQPEGGCVSWSDGTCFYSVTATPAELVAAARADTQEAGESECLTAGTSGCVNVTSSARVMAASACDEELGGLDALVMSELSQLPYGQLRAGVHGLEFNVFTVPGTNGNSSRDLQTPICSAIFRNTCTRLHTGYVFNSEFKVQMGSRVITVGWKEKPQAAVTMQIGEVALWEATCSKSSVSVMKRHVFKAGGSSVTLDHATSGRFTATVYPRCVLFTAFTWDSVRLL